MSYITPDDEKAFSAQFKHKFRRYDYTEFMDKEIELCNELMNVIDQEEELEKLWTSERFLEVMKQYVQYVPYDEHIDAMIATYHEEEINAWEEADKLFPNTRENMRREFYFSKCNENDNKIEKEDMNDEEKAWHDYVDKRLRKARNVFEGMVPARLRRSYVFEDF